MSKNILKTFILICLLSFASISFASTTTTINMIKNKNYIDFTKWYKNQYKKTVPFKSAAVFDYDTLKPLYYYQENKVIPSASLMKLVTAGTFIKYATNWNDLFSFSYADNEADLRPYVGPHDNFALLKLPYTDSLTTKDIFATMLIGSANNCANILPKCIGKEKVDFVNLMKQTAKEWGMTKTSIEEMSGLSLDDLTTAHDMGLAACNAFKQDQISQFSKLPEYDFTTTSGTEKNIKHTVHDLRLNSDKYLGAKTGYLTETDYHIAVAYITPKGKKICVAILSVKTRAESEGMIAKIAKWVDAMYK